MQVWLPWVVSIAGIGGVCFLVLLAVASFLHKSEKSWLATIVTVVGLTVALCCIVLIPADIYNASHSPCEKVVGRGEVIKIIYYVLYSILLVFAFIFAPFTFFYCDGLLDEDTTWKKRVFHGLKFTIVLVIVVAVILVLGFVLTAFNLGAPPKDPDENWEQYISSIYQNASNLEGAISFGLFMLVIVGFIVWLTYTSLGLSAWGIFLIKGTKRVDTEIRETQEEMEKTKKKKKAIDEKYESSGKKKSTKDADNKAQLEDIEEFLSQKLSTLQKLEGGWTRILSIFTPLKVVIGFAFLAFAAFIMSGVVMTLVDRIINSKCHFSCGFVLTSKGTLPNPVDLLLTYSSIYFPLDCIVFVMIVTFIVLCTVYAIYRVGIRFLWIKLYTVAPFRTLPQALVMASILIMLAILVLNFQLLSIAPQYTTFGSRTYASEASNKTVLCDMNAPVDEECPVCPMTELSYIVNRLSIQLPYVSLLLFFGTWAWVGTFIAYGLVIIFWKRASNTMTQEQIIDDADFDI